jgi:hypothetical protein
VVCTNGPGPIISSRQPDDLEAFCEALVGQLPAGKSSDAAGSTR